jgi:KaiC/GvpD/RAD55 family RecA-like ATPase
VEEAHLPERNTAAILRAFKDYYIKYRRTPNYAIIQQILTGKNGALRFWQGAHDNGEALDTDECLGLLEEYLKRVELQKMLKKSTEVYNRDGLEAAESELSKYVDWVRTFSLTGSAFTDVVNTFSSRHIQNRAKNNARGAIRAITRFYIDELDNLNQDRDLRGQLSCILAPTGIGKSHASRWIGSQACIDGFNVLHFQLEGSREEVENAYSAALVACNAYSYEKGYIKDTEMDEFAKEIAEIAGKLFVRSYPKFNQHVSTINIKEAIAEFRKNYNVKPDIIIIDSMDLLTDSSGRKYGDSGERLKRIAVANDLKDIASEEGVWVVTTYQARIENPDWVNDEKNVLTEYSSSEAKGIAQPLTHLITLNQSANERREKTMRIHVAKSRFFAKGDTFKIATDYDHERFFDRQRTANL